MDSSSNKSDEESEEGCHNTRRQFCPLELRQPLIDMVELHFCTHSSVPGKSAPNKEGIRWWAVRQIWDFCVKYDLRELWAYLWVNWYRPDRWKLWARSYSDAIPRLKTTMICESHWRRIKHDYLTHNHQPRIDYLAWILIKKLVPVYLDQLDTRLTYNGRYRKRATWRKEFKKQWKLCAVKPIEDPDKLEYNPRPYLWVCSCPAFIKSRFLICKHLVQKVHPMRPAFFYQVSRERACPVWRHPDLRPIDPPASDDLQELPKPTVGMLSVTLSEAHNSEMENSDSDANGNSTIDETSDEGEMEASDETEEKEEERMKATRSAMDRLVAQLHDLADIVDYNASFTDPRVQKLLEKRCSTALNLYQRICEKEDRINSRSQTYPSTFSSEFGDIILIHTRPKSRISQTRA
ncbi:hypothetical protein CPB86DRAFT_96189, partial [Serendipita vermifera]